MKTDIRKHGGRDPNIDGEAEPKAASSIVESAADTPRRPTGGKLRHYAGIALGGLGLTGGRAPSGPLQAHIGIADPCNHRCVMCPDHPPQERVLDTTTARFGSLPPGMMPYDRFQRTVDDLQRLGTSRIDLVGRGEPLLNPHAVDMVRYAKVRGMLVILCSNGSLLTRERAVGLHDAGLDRLNISLNAGTPETYPRIHVTETPAAYLAVKENVRRLADIRAASGSAAPYLRVSFVISTLNYFEIREMVQTVHEIGADEAMFISTVPNDATEDLALSAEQYGRLQQLTAAAVAEADELGVKTNLRTFRATTPVYGNSDAPPPPVVPCYVGWFFTNVLANGSVMPCCQCSAPIDALNDETSFAEVWSSERYKTFRTAAKALPVVSEPLESCECGNCMLRSRNISIHNFLHPWDRIDSDDDAQLFTLKDLVRMKKEDV